MHIFFSLGECFYFSLPHEERMHRKKKSFILLLFSAMRGLIKDFNDCFKSLEIVANIFFRGVTLYLFHEKQTYKIRCLFFLL